VVLQSGDPLGGAWIEVLDQLGEAVIVLDDQRTLHHVNDAARRLLGYERGQKLGGRCRLTTRGTDCENACPLTFALKAGLDRVEDFATTYHTNDGRALSLSVTVIPFCSDDGEFRGAVEILRPTAPQPGFFMVGSSEAAGTLRERVMSLARSGNRVLIVGEPPACRDVAGALHRFSGMPHELFQRWTGTWAEVNPWPPGTVYAFGDRAESLLESQCPDGWRVVVGARSDDEIDPCFEILHLPSLDDLASDLPRMIGSWLEEIAPRKTVGPAVLDRLSRMARDRGLEVLEEVLMSAVAAAGDRIEECHLPVDGYHTALVDELLRAAKPLAALEEHVLREVLERCGWRMQEAAERIGVSRVTLWRKMKDLGIEKNS
jgi:transcriptional regulator with PAS, ATPase and Fis domain